MPFASDWLYRKLGWRYFWAYGLFDVVSGFLITLATLFIFQLYIDVSRQEFVKAFIVAAANVTPNEALISELKNFVKVTIAPYKYPREIEFVEALPKTATGKLRRVELRNRG